MQNVARLSLQTSKAINGIFDPFLQPDSALHLNYFISASLLPALLTPGRSPLLSKLMAKSEHVLTIQTLDALICSMAGLPAASRDAEADLPLAAICAHGESAFDGAAAAGAAFVFADPVHLVLQRDSFSLAAPVPLLLAEEESAALLETLNKHFAADGLAFLAGRDGHWYLRCDSAPAIRTHAPGQAAGRDIQAFLPDGADAGYWRQLSNEIQMLLHAHPVNAKREADGYLPCNSLWFWGAGVLPAGGTLSGISAYASTPLLRGLAKMGLIALHPLPLHPGFELTGENVWVVFDAVQPPDERWFKAAVDALKSGRAETLTLFFELEVQVLSARLTRADLWKFWRRRASLETYCER